MVVAGVAGQRDAVPRPRQLHVQHLPEVVGDGGVLVDPSGRGLAEGLEHVLAGGSEIEDRVDRGRRRAAHFTWERSARRHAEVWASVV